MAAVFGPLRRDMAEITGRYDAKEADERSPTGSTL
jgi:hypothetical protein